MLKIYKQTNKRDVLPKLATNSNTFHVVENKHYVAIFKKEGKFLMVFNEDALIFNFLFGYKVLTNLKCGFPNNILEKNLKILEESNISYKIFDKDKEVAFKDFSSKNNYDDILEKFINYSSLNNRLDLLIKRVKFASPEKLKNILKYIQECLK